MLPIHSENATLVVIVFPLNLPEELYLQTIFNGITVAHPKRRRNGEAANG
jgi:hypothetical protein